MPWFRVDDQFHGHPKGRRAGLAALGLWSMAGSMSMSYKLDGFVPDWYVASWPSGKRLAAQLVASGLWSNDGRDGEPGWTFHDWDHYQDSADQIEEDRDRARIRQRNRRDRLRQARQEADRRDGHA